MLIQFDFGGQYKVSAEKKIIQNVKEADSIPFIFETWKYSKKKERTNGNDEKDNKQLVLFDWIERSDLLEFEAKREKKFHEIRLKWTNK